MACMRGANLCTANHEDKHRNRADAVQAGDVREVIIGIPHIVLEEDCSSQLLACISTKPLLVPKHLFASPTAPANMTRVAC